MTDQTARVLVVDDQDAGRFVKAQMLRRAGFTVYEAGSGREAMDIVRSTAIDLVVLDVNLPDISGLEVGRLLREMHPGPPSIQILHVSSTAIGDKDRAEGLNAGADAYLSEPVEASVLVATANALLRVRRAERSMAEALAREQRARGEAEQANRLKDDFIATLSHELRTPLNALMGWIFQLRQTSLTDTARLRALDSLERNTRVQAQLINDLLDVSRISKGKLQLQIRAVNIAQVGREVVDSVSSAARLKGVALDVSAQTVYVAGDEGRLQQIVGNLLNNAVQFTPEGGRISLTVSRDSGNAIIRVTDTGAGIEPELVPYVFEPFRQGKDGLARVHGGLGLGLAVVQQLVELHDGRVDVTSEGQGRGSTFTVQLPEIAPPPRGPEGTGLLLRDMEVMVIAEGAESRETLVGVLESSGASIASATDAGDSSRTVDAIVRDGPAGVIVAPAIGSDHTLPEVRLPRPVRPARLVRAVAALKATRAVAAEPERLG